MDFLRGFSMKTQVNPRRLCSKFAYTVQYLCNKLHDCQERSVESVMRMTVVTRDEGKEIVGKRGRRGGPALLC